MFKEIVNQRRESTIDEHYKIKVYCDARNWMIYISNLSSILSYDDIVTWHEKLLSKYITMQKPVFKKTLILFYKYYDNPMLNTEIQKIL
jgi:hypothetical protein